MRVEVWETLTRDQLDRYLGRIAWSCRQWTCAEFMKAEVKKRPDFLATERLIMLAEAYSKWCGLPYIAPTTVGGIKTIIHRKPIYSWPPEIVEEQRIVRDKVALCIRHLIREEQHPVRKKRRQRSADIIPLPPWHR